MSNTTTTETLALRDETGIWYVLTPETLVTARATAEQVAELSGGIEDDTTGFALFVSTFGWIKIAPAPAGSPRDLLRPTVPRDA